MYYSWAGQWSIAALLDVIEPKIPSLPWTELVVHPRQHRLVVAMSDRLLHPCQGCRLPASFARQYLPSLHLRGHRLHPLVVAHLEHLKDYPIWR